MALKIRLSRGGAKKRPYYKIVVADIRNPRDGHFIERLGSFNPLLGKDNENRIVLNKERIEYWLGVGAKPTDRVARFLSAEGMVKWEHGNNPNKAKPGQKAMERLEASRQAEEDAKTAAKEAKAAAAEAAAPAEEAPAEEVPAEEEKAAE